MILDKNTRFVKENRPDRHYINNEDLLELLREYNRTKIISDKLCESFMLMAKNIAKERGFREKPYIDDCIQSGVTCCIKYIHNFKEEASKNPFAYFTQCIKFAFVNVIKKENKFIDFKKKLLQYDSEGYLISGEAFNGEDWNSNSLYNEDYNNDYE